MGVARLRVVDDAPSYAEIPDDYRDEYLLCRGIRHAWGRPSYYRATIGGLHRWMMCTRCGTERTDTREGGVVRRKYEYPDGYSLEGRVLATDVWDATLARAEVYESEEEMRAKTRRRGRRTPRR